MCYHIVVHKSILDNNIILNDVFETFLITQLIYYLKQAHILQCFFSGTKTEIKRTGSGTGALFKYLEPEMKPEP